MNYSELTDSEINIAIHTVINGKPKAHQFYSWKDYCNDWAAIGPIIQDNAISLIPVHHVDSVYWTTGWNNSKCDTPMRAAAECFLMMQGTKG